MGFDDAQIILNSENGAYYAGQTVYGRVKFSQGKKKTIHGIYVDFKGFCKVHWTTSRSRMINNRTQYYTVNHDSQEEYFRRKQYLFGNEHDENHLQAGEHDFKFECPIPYGCPSSFEGTYGFIRYRIKVVMVTSAMFSMNKDKMVHIKVHAPVDLNQHSSYREPIEFDLSTSYCCWCLNAGLSEIMVRLPVAGYCPGQIIPIEVTCKNSSSVKIDVIKFAIKKDVTFLALTEPGTRNEHDTVVVLKKGPVPGHTTRNWTIEMEVPPMDIVNVEKCHFINIEYSFKVSTEVGFWHDSADKTHPITFGTIPLVGFQDNVPNPLQDQLPRPIAIATDANCYPPPPIINQPLSNSHYPNSNGYPGNPALPTTPNLAGRTSPYPGNEPYPNISPYPPNPPSYPGGNPPYPGRNSPYPGGNPPYPGDNPSYPGEKSPFLGANPAYPGGNSPYPPGSSPYPPGSSPNPGNTPYSSDKSPYGSNSNFVPPHPGARQSPVPPYSAGSTPLKTRTIGFGAPIGASVPYPTSPVSNPYATASAPEPSTPGSDNQNLHLDNCSEPPPYNPEFMKNPDEKQQENVQNKVENKENGKANNDEKDTK